MSIKHYDGQAWQDAYLRPPLRRPVGGDPAQNVSSTNFCTFADAYAAWRNGERFPVAFMGDSTFSFGGNSGDHVWFCEVLQNMLREECGAYATIYNAGIPGITLEDGLASFDGFFGETGTFADAKMVGIGYGINDRLVFQSLKDYKAGVYARTEAIIRNCYERGIQPFLLTHQATLECGVGTELQSYPLRDSHSMAFANVAAKRELAAKYDIPLIELNQATEEYLLYSKVPANTIMMDNLHFGDVGHAYEAGFLFAEFVSRVIPVEAGRKTIVSYVSQNIRHAVPEDKLSYGGDFKVYANYTKANSADTKIFDAYVFVKGCSATLRACKPSGGSTYVRIDGATTVLASQETELGELDLGLHHLEVFTGANTAVKFCGFVLNAATATGGASATHYFPEDGSGDYIAVSGSRIKVVNTNKIGGFYNLSDLSAMANTAINTENINNQPEKFKLSPGDVVALNVRNVTGWNGGESKVLVLGFRDTGSGNLALFTIFPDETGSFSNTITVETGGSVGCLYFYLLTGDEERFELDTEVTVNGNRVFG